MSISPTYLDFFFNETRTDLTHLVPTINGFDNGEDVATVCGLITSTADFWAKFDLCPACVKGAEERS